MLLQVLSKSNSTSKLTPSSVWGGEEEVAKEKEFDAAIAESRVYEESQTAEATMRRVRLEEASKKRTESLKKLNGATLARIQEALIETEKDVLKELEAIVTDYKNEIYRIEKEIGGPSGKLRLKEEMPLCYVCQEFHGIAEWNGMCSRCRVIKKASKVHDREPDGHQFISSASCAAALSRVFFRHHRRKLPAPPSAAAMAKGKRLLETRLKAHNRKIFQVKGDGACQFRSVAHQLFDDEKHHPIVRDRALSYLSKHRPLVHDCEVYVSPRHHFLPGPHSTTTKPNAVSVVSIGDDFSKYLKVMANDASWGDATTLQAIASVFRVRILLLTSHSSNYELVLEPDQPAVREIWIGFFAEMHYVSVVPDFNAQTARHLSPSSSTTSSSSSNTASTKKSQQPEQPQSKVQPPPAPAPAPATEESTQTSNDAALLNKHDMDDAAANSKTQEKTQQEE